MALHGMLVTLYQAFLILHLHLRADSDGHIWRVVIPLLLPLNAWCMLCIH